MTMEITLERLPDRVSDAVDAAVGRFLGVHQGERLQCRRRYHGADLWMIFRHEPLGEVEPAFLTRRVTIGAFSDEPNQLQFIPDIVVTRPSGRFTLLPSGRKDKWYRGRVPAIDALQYELLIHNWRDGMDSRAFDAVLATLESAWHMAIALKADQATQLVA